MYTLYLGIGNHNAIYFQVCRCGTLLRRRYNINNINNSFASRSDQQHCSMRQVFNHRRVHFIVILLWHYVAVIFNQNHYQRYR